MPSLVADTPGSRLRLESSHLLVMGPEDIQGRREELASVPLEGLDRVMLHAGVQITSQALTAVLERGAPVGWLDWRGELLGLCTGGPSRDAPSRLRQYAVCQDAAWSAHIAARIIHAKTVNQLRLLQRLEASRPRLAAEAVAQLTSLRDRTAALTSDPDRIPVAEIRGLEGAAAAAWFPLWGQFLPEAFPFLRRSAHPPLDPVNAVLSFTSSLVYHHVTAALQQAGLDAALGFLHTADASRWSLALDLMEPLRPALAEAFTLRLFTRGILRQEHFEPRERGIWLASDGRKLLLAHWETRMDRPFFSEQAARRTTLRQAITDQCHSFKRALFSPEGPAVFTPFLLN